MYQWYHPYCYLLLTEGKTKIKNDDREENTSAAGACRTYVLSKTL